MERNKLDKNKLDKTKQIRHRLVYFYRFWKTNSRSVILKSPESHGISLSAPAKTQFVKALPNYIKKHLCKIYAVLKIYKISISIPTIH